MKKQKLPVTRILENRRKYPLPLFAFLLVMNGLLSFIIVLLKILLLLGVLGSIISAIVAIYLYSSVCVPLENEMRQVAVSSNIADFSLDDASYVYDVSGNMISKISGENDGVYLEYEKIPENVVNAFVAVEV